MPVAREKQEKNSKLRHTEYYDLQPTFDKLYADSCNKKIFNNLYSIVVCDENIKLAYRNIKRNSGSVTSGTDGCAIPGKMDTKKLQKRNESQYFVGLRKPTAFIPRFA